MDYAVQCLQNGKDLDAIWIDAILFDVIFQRPCCLMTPMWESTISPSCTYYGRNTLSRMAVSYVVATFKSGIPSNDIMQLRRLLPALRRNTSLICTWHARMGTLCSTNTLIITDGYLYMWYIYPGCNDDKYET